MSIIRDGKLFRRYEIECQEKDLAHAAILDKVIGDIGGKALIGISDELHEMRVRNKPMTPIAEELWKSIQEYYSVMQSEAAEEERANQEKAAKDEN